MLNVVMLNVIMLNVVMLNVVMLNVVATFLPSMSNYETRQKAVITLNACDSQYSTVDVLLRNFQTKKTNLVKL
jgi:hypothetical protein